MNELSDPYLKREKHIAKIGLLLLVVALAVGLSAYLVLPETQQCYIVKRVIDGDTVQLSVKYVGIDTPETVHPSMPVEWYGKEAFEFNKKLVEGKEVYLELDVEQKDIWLFRLKCGNKTCYRKATITLRRKFPKLRKPNALRLMSLILLLIPSTIPLVVRW